MFQNHEYRYENCYHVLLLFQQGEQESHLREEKVSVLRLVQIKELRKPLVISVVLQLAQQFSGINAVC